MTRQANFLEQVLEYALAQPPAQAGRRLHPERVLESRLGVGRRQVNEALNRLAERGLVARQRGSGTFVRKIQPIDPDRFAELRAAWSEAGLESPEQLFADTPTVPQADQRRQRRQRLHLGLWGDWTDPQPRHQATIGEMIRCVQAAGHMLTVHSMVSEPHVPLPVEVVADQLEQNPCDGYLVVYRWGKLFKAAVGEASAPVVYCGGGRSTERHQPYVVSDSFAVITEGVYRLAAEGFERIALLSLVDPDKTPEPHERVYERAMADAGLTYHACACMNTQHPQLGQRFAELMKRSDPPDALIVADDHLLSALSDALAQHGLEPGRDLGLVCQTNRGITSLPDPGWSRMEVDPCAIGQLAVQHLLALVENPKPLIYNLTIEPTWLPGRTHLHPQGAGRRRGNAHQSAGTEAPAPT